MSSCFFNKKLRDVDMYFLPFFFWSEKFASCKQMQLRIIVPFKALHFNEEKVIIVGCEAFAENIWMCTSYVVAVVFFLFFLKQQKGKAFPERWTRQGCFFFFKKWRVLFVGAWHANSFDTVRRYIGEKETYGEAWARVMRCPWVEHGCCVFQFFASGLCM